MVRHDIFNQGINQDRMKKILDRRRKTEQVSKKVIKAQERRLREERFRQHTLPTFQLERALKNVVSGNLREADIAYIFEQGPRLGRKVDDQITIVEISDINGRQQNTHPILKS